MPSIPTRSAVATVLWLLLMPLTAAAQGSEILVGQIASRTGNNPGGRDNESGATLAVAEINAAGGVLGGRQIRLRVEDDQTRADHAVAAFERLAQLGVSAVVGTSFSNASLAVIPSAERARIPYVSTGAADAHVEPVRPFIYMTSLAGRLVAEQLLRYLHDTGVRKLAVVYDEDSLFAKSGWAKQRAMLAAYDIDVVAAHAVKVDTQDFAPAIKAVTSGDSQAVMGWLTGPPAVGFVKQYRQSGKDVPLVMSHGVASPAFVESVGEAAEGIIVATARATVAEQLPESDARRVALAMTREFAKTYGHPPSQFAIDGYVAVKLIAAAIDLAGSDRPVAIQAALDRLSLLTPQGTYRYSNDDHSGLQADDIVMAKIHNGEFTLTDWSRQRLQ
jgi:branched-chain amino acid transport system substrate-binding protein